MSYLDVLDFLQFFGGLALFLFGMKMMSAELEKSAGSKLKDIMSRFTKNKYKSFLSGFLSTAAVQSSSAVTVMTVGFVNGGIMTLKGAVGVIIGSNVGTTATSWLLGLSGIGSDNIFLELLKPASLASIAAVAGLIINEIHKDKHKSSQSISSALIGFAVLMFGMETMSGSVIGLKDEEWFLSSMLIFSHPATGLFAGILLTALMQSSSAAIGMLQALSVTGSLSYGACIPIILGQNIGTCVTTLIASAGAGKNAKCAALIHLYFNLLSAAVFAAIAFVVYKSANLPIFSQSANGVGIAAIHTVFNVFAAVLMMPLSEKLETLAIKTASLKKNIA